MLDQRYEPGQFGPRLFKNRLSPNLCGVTSSLLFSPPVSPARGACGEVHSESARISRCISASSWDVRTESVEKKKKRRFLIIGPPMLPA